MLDAPGYTPPGHERASQVPPRLRRHRLRFPSARGRPPGDDRGAVPTSVAGRRRTLVASDALHHRVERLDRERRIEGRRTDGQLRVRRGRAALLVVPLLVLRL